MKKLYENEDIAIYSDKEFFINDGRYLKFKDGSNVDLNDYSIVNYGVGEIEIIYLPIRPEQDNLISKKLKFESIDAISLTGGNIILKIAQSETTESHISIIGTEEFFSRLDLNQVRGMLEIHTARDSNNIIIGDVWINGKRQKPAPDPLYGEITIYTKRLDSLQVDSNGKGYVYSELPINQLYLKIKGSLSTDLVEVGQADVKISGSGNVIIKSLLNNSQFNISGSGSVTIDNGVIDEINLEVSGSGSINAIISVKRAYLNMTGSGSIVIDHVKEFSRERKGGSGSIKVLRRG